MGGELCVLGFLRNYSHVRQLQSYWSLSCDHGFGLPIRQCDKQVVVIMASLYDSGL